MSIKNQAKNSNSLNIKQSTYELIPKIRELAKTMSQKEVQEKLKINKKTLKKIKDIENIKFRTSYLPFEKTKKSIPYAERYTAEEKSEMYRRRKVNETELDKEIKNLIIYKKGLFNSNSASEEELLSIFKPLLNTENIWKSHSLYVIAEYFFAKNEKQKSKEFFEKILEQENSNTQIKIEAQKRLQRDFGV